MSHTNIFTRPDEVVPFTPVLPRLVVPPPPAEELPSPRHVVLRSCGATLSAALAEHREVMARYFDEWRDLEDEIILQALARTTGNPGERACLPPGRVPEVIFVDSPPVPELLREYASDRSEKDMFRTSTVSTKRPAEESLHPTEASRPTDAITTDVMGDITISKSRIDRAKKVRTQITKQHTVVHLAKTGVSVFRLMRSVENNRFFEAICSVVILANTVFLAYASEQNMDGAEHSEQQVFDAVFCALYSIELAVRMGSRKLRFFYGREWRWNWFDMFLVLTSIYEQVYKSISSSSSGQSGGSSVGYLRVARLLKMLKVLRVVRLMRAFRELRFVLDSVMGSMRSMFWSMVMVATIAFMFSICFMQGVADHLRKGVAAADEANLLDSWGSLGMSMLTLFMTATGGVDWKDTFDALWGVGSQFGFIFILFVGFFLFVVMNSITSIFVEGARDYAERDDSVAIQEQLCRKEEFMSKIIVLYQQMDENNLGEVTYDSFSEHMSDPQMVAFAESLDIDTTNLQQFFNILSANGTRTVDVETFVVGCIKLRGMAKSMDMMDVLISQRKLQEDHSQLRLQLNESFSQLRASIESCGKGSRRERATTSMSHGSRLSSSSAAPQ